MTRAKPEEIVVFRDAPSLEISVGASHTLALLDKFLYSFGVDDCGQLGQGYTDGIATPIPVKFFKGVKMLAISAGFRHSSCITEKHEVYAWGSSKTAQVHTQSAIKYTIMKMLPGLEGVKAVKLFGGFTSSYTFIQAEHGEIYSFGDNGYLNCGVIGSAAIPKRVSFLQSKRSFAIILDRVKTFILSLEAEPVMNISTTILFDDVSIKTLQ
jgi:alpha-tubulin suppressor-like RCC1 family protein